MKNTRILMALAVIGLLAAGVWSCTPEDVAVGEDNPGGGGNAGGFDANGASNSLFSVSATKQVKFSKGNLQFSAEGTHTVSDGGTATGTWRFAEYQYDYIGDGNENISSDYAGWIDLFGWGTSGWNSGANAYQPWDTSTRITDYWLGGSSDNSSLIGTYANADWGVYNAISNGGNQAGMWRTLTKDEWEYLMYTRSVTYRYAKATVNGIYGMIIFPDSFTSPSSVAVSGVNNGDASFATNIYSHEQWAVLQNAGCIFLPAAGGRSGTRVTHTWFEFGDYWSSTSFSENWPYLLHFVNGDVYVSIGSQRPCGLSVRLVQDNN